MWTQEQTDAYNKSLTTGRKDAVKLGKEIGDLIKSKMREDRGKSCAPDAPGINSIFLPLILEPIMAALDDGYEVIGQCNFKWMVDLYIGRKCRKIVPLLLEIAKRLKAGKHDEHNKAEGHWSDGNIWYNVVSATYISLQFDTQSRQYSVTMEDRHSSGGWKLYVTEYKRDKKPKKAKESWQKEPGYVLEYEYESDIIMSVREIEQNKVENAWLNLTKINRFLEMINPLCTSLDINLYKPPFLREC